MYTVKLPLHLTVRNAKCLIERCEQAILSSEKDILFDFAICAFIDPFATTLLVGAMKACVAKGHEVLYEHSQSKKLERYFKNIGFYGWGAGTGKKNGVHH